MIKRYVPTMCVAVVLALTAVVGVSALDTTTKVADAASYVTVKGCTGTNINLTNTKYRNLYLHNQTRARDGLPGFCVHPYLQNAARAHSAEMISRDYFSHNSDKGESFSNRLKRYGYTPLPNRY